MTEHPLQTWMSRHGSVVVELSAAMHQHALETSWANDDPESRDLAGLRVSVERLLTATDRARLVPPPLDPAVSAHWDAALRHFQAAARRAATPDLGRTVAATRAMAADYDAGIAEVRRILDAIRADVGQATRPSTPG